MTALRSYLLDDSGAVTIDWVALTAGILLLAIALIYGIFSSGVSSLSKKINSNLVKTGDGINVGTGPGQPAFSGT